MTATLLRKISSAVILLWVAFGLAACGGFMSKTNDNRHNQPLSSEVRAGLSAMGSSPAEAMVVRIFKQEQTLEVWKHTSAGDFKLFKSYPICTYSGDIGPKFQEGDRQSPEGFYTISPGLMNPRSAYYLAFNTGFPNKFDRANGRSGSNLMVHGDCKSVGCYAMTDTGIAEIFALARESFKGGNPSFQLQIFPFRMTPENMAKQASNQHLAFWKNIKQGYDLFEVNKAPPAWDVCERKYIFNAIGGGALDPLAACPATVQNAALSAKQQADESAYVSAVDSQAQKDARLASEKLALQQREAAIGGFLGGILGGGQQSNAAVTADATAPVPMSAPLR